MTFVARACATYTDITANRARNDIQESLRDLGADTPYRPGAAMDPAVEQSHQPACRPLRNWSFTLGTGYRTRAVSGPWGSLSIVTGAFAGPAILTKSSTPLLDDRGRPTGRSIAGADTIELTREQATIAARPNNLWAQGGSTTDPILNQRFPGQYGFGALRCAIDDLNGDNVEWIGFPTGVRHVFCFAYYVTPPPTSGTIVVRKEVQTPPGASEAFAFEGNLSFNQRGLFTLAVKHGQPAQQTFIRAQTRPGEPPWNVHELVPANWTLSALKCSSLNGQSAARTDLASASASIALAPGDTVTCTYTDALVPPPGGLSIRKLTLGGTGRFAFALAAAEGVAPTQSVAPAQNVGPAAAATLTPDIASVSAVAETREAGVAVDAEPSPLSLAPGDYKLSEQAPASDAGSWALSHAECDGRELAPAAPIEVPIVSGAATLCTLTNTFTPDGAISLHKITLGATASTGFVISPLSGPPAEVHQVAHTTHEGVPATALGEPSDGLALGRYLIQETTSEPAGDGHWELTAVRCDGRDEPFADGQATIDLTTATPRQTCTFTNTHHSGEPPVPPKPPTPTVDPDSRLTIVKHADQAQVHVGEPSAYTLTVTNDGPDAATEVVVDDQPSGPARFSSADPSQGSCTHTVPTTCTLGTIPAGHHVTIAIVVIPTEVGIFPNRAVLGTASLDPTYTHDAAEASVRSTRSRAAPSHPRPGPHFTG